MPWSDSEMSSGCRRIEPTQRQEWIAYQLTGSVIGDVPATIDPAHRNATLPQLILVPKQVGGIARPAKGVDVRMLQQKERGRSPPIRDLRGVRILKAPG